LNVAEFRAEFPAVQTCIYADSAAIGPLPRSAAQAASSLHTALCTQGSRVFPGIFEPVESARNRTAALLGCMPQDIGFTDCTSTSMNLLARMALQGPSRQRSFVTLADEFPSTTLPWIHHGFAPQWVQAAADGHYPVDAILDTITPDTRAVVVSHVQYRTGACTDVATLGQALADQDVWLVVNATQAAGIVPQDVSLHTATTVTALKWLCGGFGTGILHLSAALRSEHTLPDQGWISQQDFMGMKNDRLDPVQEARGIELGGVGLTRLHVLDASLALIQRVTPQALRAQTLAVTRALRQGLEDRGTVLITPRRDDRRAGILSALRTDAESWHRWALARGIVQSMRGPGTIRFALHGFNNNDDVARILESWDTKK
jgi:selenocysteine lyase/cysteine desulfurase